MPIMDGLTAAKCIFEKQREFREESPDLPDIKIAILSAYDSSEVRKEAY